MEFVNKRTTRNTHLNKLTSFTLGGAVGLNPEASYYVYDFWSDLLVGKLKGTEKIKKNLEPSHCAMLSVRKVQPNPQVLSTSRHVLQGWVDLAEVKWDPATKQLSGVAKAVGGEPFRITVANNGFKPVAATAGGGAAKLEKQPAGDLSVIELSASGSCPWSIKYE